MGTLLRQVVSAELSRVGEPQSAPATDPPGRFTAPIGLAVHSGHTVEPLSTTSLINSTVEYDP